MAARNYSNTATEATLTGSITSAETMIAVTSFAGYPAAPFTAAIDRGTADEEVVLVTAVSGTTSVTVSRGYNGTTAKSHTAGAAFQHVTIALDYDEANDHINASTGVHGVTGAVVGTSDVQTLSNKSLAAPAIENPTVTGTAAMASATVAGTLAVTGATSGSTAAFSGTVDVGSLTSPGVVQGASVESAHVLILPELSVTPANQTAGKANLYGWVNGGIYYDPSTNPRRLTAHWGFGTALPTGVVEGDTYRHTGLGCTLRYNGTSWRQQETTTVADLAARNAISTTYSALLHEGFRVHQSSTDATLTWDGAAWVKTAGKVSRIAVLANGGAPAVVPNNNTATTLLSQAVTLDEACNIDLKIATMLKADTNAAGNLIATWDDVEVGTTRWHNGGTGYGVYEYASTSGRFYATAGAHTFAVKLKVDSSGGAVTTHQNHLELFA